MGSREQEERCSTYPGNIDVGTYFLKYFLWLPAWAPGAGKVFPALFHPLSICIKRRFAT
jgi:hypothetical protein